MIDFSLFGAGLIGSVHAGNIARDPKARLRYIVDACLGQIRPVSSRSRSDKQGPHP
jgi:hypothetical protein